jgi:hypothetical protein
MPADDFVVTIGRERRGAHSDPGAESVEDRLRRLIALSMVVFAVPVVLAAAISTSPVAGASVDRVVPLQASTPPPCIPTHSKIDGHPATTFCGPATVTLKSSGKTYKFKGGYCKEFDGLLTDITLGTLVGVHGTPNTTDNLKKPYLRMDLGVGDSSDLQIPYYGGNLLGAVGPFKWHGGVTTKGTFTSLGATPSSFSGTYNCHGVFVRG